MYLHVHGVFMEIQGIGVLLKGRSGIGKSEAALALLDRGAYLIADDIAVFHVVNQNIVGSCPENLQDLLEVRGLGILNIAHLLGSHSIKKEVPLHLIIHCITQENISISLMPNYSEEEILGLSVPQIQLPVTVGKNIALLIEIAVKYHLQKKPVSL